GGLSAGAMEAEAARSQHRSPSRAQPDGLFQPPWRGPAAELARRRLSARRHCGLGPGARRGAHRNGGGPERLAYAAERDRPQHRVGAEDGRCAVRLEDHRPLSLFWTEDCDRDARENGGIGVAMMDRVLIAGFGLLLGGLVTALIKQKS